MRLRAWWIRLCGTFGSENGEQDFAAEMETHLQMHIDDNLRSGMTLDQARRDANLRLGGLEQTKQAYRERQGLPWIETLWQDIRFGLRMICKSPGFTSVAGLTLALGIGANTTIFTLMDALYLKLLAVSQPEQLVRIYRNCGSFGYRRQRIPDHQTTSDGELAPGIIGRRAGSGLLFLGKTSALEVLRNRQRRFPPSLRFELRLACALLFRGRRSDSGYIFRVDSCDSRFLPEPHHGTQGRHVG
jgi:hypothetical protein